MVWAALRCVALRFGYIVLCAAFVFSFEVCGCLFLVWVVGFLFVVWRVVVGFFVWVLGFGAWRL